MRWYDSFMEKGIGKLLTVEELMGMLRISRPTLYRLLKAGKLEPVRIGKRVLFEMSDIRAFIDRAKTGEKPKGEKPKRKGRQKERKQEVQTEKARKKSKPPKRVAPPEMESPAKGKTTGKKSEDADKQGRLL